MFKGGGEKKDYKRFWKDLSIYSWGHFTVFWSKRLFAHITSLEWRDLKKKPQRGTNPHGAYFGCKFIAAMTSDWRWTSYDYENAAITLHANKSLCSGFRFFYFCSLAAQNKNSWLTSRDLLCKTWMKFFCFCGFFMFI